MRAAFLERRVVEERVGLRARGCRARRRRARRCRSRRRSIEPSRRPSSTSRNPSTSIASVQAVLDGLRARSGGPSAPGSARRAASRGRPGPAGTRPRAASSARMRRSGGGTRRPPRKRSTRSERCAFQRQRVSNIGAARTACIEHLARGRGMQVVEHLLELEAVLRAERQHDGLLVGRRLQLESETHAEPLAQREPPRPVDAAAERRVHDELRAAALVEEALEHDAALCRDAAERVLPRRHVVRDLDGPTVGQRAAGLFPEPGRDARRRILARRARLAQNRDRRGQLARAARAPRPARTGSSAAVPSRRRRARRRARRGEFARRCCRAGRCPRRSISIAKSSLTVPTSVPSGSMRTW